MTNKKKIYWYVLKWIAGLVCGLIILSLILVVPLKWFNPPTTAFVMQDDVRESLLLGEWTPINDVSGYLPLAIIAAEDQRFPDHYGIDFIELEKALAKKGGPTRGASTLTQQLAKNLYLWSGKSFLRKGIEAWLALTMELFLSKQRILELYVNVIEFGPGVYGVNEASTRFFDKTPVQLNRADASLLATVLPNPKTLRLSRPTAYMYERAQDIRFAMRALGGAAYLKRLDPSITPAQ